jgi:hypothetical protein
MGRRMKMRKRGDNSLSLLSTPKDLPSLGDLLSQQAGISIGACQPKCSQTATGASSSPPLQSSLMLVSSDL